MAQMLTTATAKAQAFAWYPTSTLTAGRGLEIDNPALLKATAVQFDALEQSENDVPVSTQPKFEVSEITDSRALESFTTFDFDLDANFLFFSGGTTVPWMTSYNFAGPCFVFGLRGYSDFGRFDLKNVALTQEAKNEAKTPTTFESQYGDAYVSQVRKAAIISVLFEIDDAAPSTLANLQKLISVGPTYSNVGGQITGNFDQFLTQAMELGTVRFRIITEGGPPVTNQTGALSSVADIAALDSLITQYSSGIDDGNTAPVVYYTSPYTALGVTLPDPAPSTVQQKLEDLANLYYGAAQQKQKLESIIGDWNEKYVYLDRNLLPTYKADIEQFDAYIASLVALAPEVRDSPDTVALPDPPTLEIAWPQPYFSCSYHNVSVAASSTGPAQAYTVVNAAIHGAVVKQIVLAQGATSVNDLVQSQEDETYLMAHVDQSNFLYNDQFYGNRGLLPGASKSELYVMRWVIAQSTTPLSALTAVALDSNGQVIATAPVEHVPDKFFSVPPANSLSE